MDTINMRYNIHEHDESPDLKIGTSVAESSGYSDVDIFLDELTTEALTHRAVCHPYLGALVNGAFLDLRGALQDFARQYDHYSKYFTRFLNAVLSKLGRSDHRLMLMENLLEESGTLSPDELRVLLDQGIDPQWVQGISHPELFKRFRQALGVDVQVAHDTCVEAMSWREAFYTYIDGGSAAEAVGAIGLGTEYIVKYIYRDLIRAIERYGELDRVQYIFFELHCEVDDHHHQTLLRIAGDFARTELGKTQLRQGMHKALDLRAKFWDGMYQRALQHFS